MYRYFKTFTENNVTFISSWESKGLTNEKIGSTKTSNYDQSSRLVHDSKHIVYIPIVNIYFVYRLTPRTNNSCVTLENCLFGTVKLIKNPDIDKYKCCGYDIGFDSKGSFSHPSGGYGKRC